MKEKQYYIDSAPIYIQTKTIIAYKKIHKPSLICDQ